MADEGLADLTKAADDFEANLVGESQVEQDQVRPAQLFDWRVRASEQEHVDALDGRLPGAHRLVLKQRLDRIELLERQRDELQRRLEQLMEHCASAVKRLTAVPGINVVAAQHLIAEIGPEVSAFPSAGQLASWVGVCPGRQESAGISRSNRCATDNRFV